MQLITELAPERATEIITKPILLLKKSFIETLFRCLAQSKNRKGLEDCTVLYNITYFVVS